MRRLQDYRDTTVSIFRMNRYRLSVGILLIVAVLVVANLPRPSMASRKHLVIMVSGAAKIVYLPAILTQRLGYFRDEGLDVELVSRPAGVDAENELLTG